MKQDRRHGHCNQMSSARVVRSYNGDTVVVNVSSLVKLLLKLGVTLARSK